MIRGIISPRKDVVELVLDGLVEPLAYAVGLRAVGLRSGMVDILDREVELIGMVFDLAAVFRATIREHAQQADPVLREQGDHPVIEQICSRDCGLLGVEFTHSDAGVGVDKSLLVDSSFGISLGPMAFDASPFHITHITSVLTAQKAGMVAFDLAVRFFLLFRLFQRSLFPFTGVGPKKGLLKGLFWAANRKNAREVKPAPKMNMLMTSPPDYYHNILAD